MSIVALFTNQGYNVLATIGIVLVIGLILFFENKFIKKKEEKWPRFILAVFFFISFVVLLLGAILVMLVWGFDFESYYLSIQSDVVTYIEASIGALIGTLFVLLLSMFLLKIAKLTFKNVGLKPGPLQKRKKTIGKVTLSIIRYFVGIIALLVILAIWGVNVMPALAGLGIMGLVIGLGAQKFINDLISGFFIIFEHHFDVGDKIEVQGFKGEVTDIGLKTTRVVNWKGDIKILANGEINTLINFSKNASIAEVEFGIAYEADINKTIEVLKQALPKLLQLYPQVIETPQVLGVTKLDNSSVNIKVICKTLNEQHYGVERGLRQLIKETLDQHGIEIPFPQVVVSYKDKA